MKSDTRDIKNKIELLCYGLRTNETVEHIYNLQNPYDLTGTGNAGLQLKVGDSRLIANIPVFNKFTSQSPYSIETDCNNNYFVKNLITEECFSVEVVQSPQLYLDTISNGNHVGQYILREGADTLICSITKSCGYVYHNQQCRFCAISANSTHNTSENEDERYDSLLEAIEIVLKSPIPEIKSINLTGGNTLDSDKGLNRYLRIIRYIRSHSNIPICIECSPPETNDSLQLLKDESVNVIMMNVKLWDERLREMYMPGKSKISVGRYIDAWKYAVKAFGKGNVSSVLIIGLESELVEREAVDKILSYGVMPSIMPFRPNDGATLENFRLPDPKVVYKLTEYAAKSAKIQGISYEHAPGCLGCGACAAEKDFISIEENENE